MTEFEQSLRQHFGSILQGNILPTIEQLRSADPATLSDENLSQRDNYLNRFDKKIFPNNPNLPDFVQSILNIYFNYWHSLLMQTRDVSMADKWLGNKLNQLLLNHGLIHSKFSSAAKREEAIIKHVESAGLGILLDVTIPYRECMVWQSQTRKQYTVNLHDTSSTFDVVFLDEFASFGWIGFASFNKAHTGGWAKTDAVYRVGQPPKDEHDEQFYLDILCHEGRHFSDYQRFPNLKQPELEYRAKLSELCFATKSMQHRINQFMRSRSPDPQSAPHTFAAHHVIQDLSQALFGPNTVPAQNDWNSLDVKHIHTASTQILDQNNNWLMANNQKNIGSFLGQFNFQPAVK